MGYKTWIFALFVYSISAWGKNTTTKLTIEEICQYDNFCARLKNSDGTLIKPKQSTLEFIAAFSEEIKSKAAKLGIDPKALAGAIVGENSLNVQVDDVVQDFLVQMKLTPKANVLGKKFTIGMGQIHLDTAMETEKLLAKTFSRKERSEEEVAQALLTPDGAIEYAGGIVRHSQDCYKNEGFDVSQDPALLTTLYNLGKACEKAKELKRSGKKPRPNYFGFFVEQNLTALDNSLNRPQETLDYQEPKGDENNQILAETVVYSKVPSCYKNGAGQVGEYNQARTFSEAPVLGTLKGPFRIISRNVDCDLKSWVMIEDSSGRVGWLSNDELKKSAKIDPYTLKRLSPTYFDCSIDKTCVEKLKPLLGKNFVSFDTETGLITAKYLGKKNDIPADPSSFEQGCMQNDIEARANNRNIPGGQPAELKKENAENAIKDLNNLKKKIQSVFKIKDEDWQSSPFSMSINQFIAKLTPCKEVTCKFYPEQIKKILSISINQNSLADYVRISNELNSMDLIVYPDGNLNYANNSPGGYMNNFGGIAMTGMNMGMNSGMNIGGTSSGTFPNKASSNPKKNKKNAKNKHTTLPKNAKTAQTSNNYNAYGYGVGTIQPKLTAEDYINTYKKCRNIFDTDPNSQKDIDKIITELGTIYKKTPLNSYNGPVVQWLCERSQEKLSGKKINTDKTCDNCSIRINLQGTQGNVSTKILGNYIGEIEKDDLLKMIKSAMWENVQDFYYQIPGMQKLYNNYYNQGSYDTDQVCNYEPFKNKDLISKLLNDDCSTRVLTDDAFLVGSFRESKKQVLQFKPLNSYEYSIQVRRTCGAGYHLLNDGKQKEGVL